MSAFTIPHSVYVSFYNPTLCLCQPHCVNQNCPIIETFAHGRKRQSIITKPHFRVLWFRAGTTRPIFFENGCPCPCPLPFPSCLPPSSLPFEDCSPFPFPLAYTSFLNTKHQKPLNTTVCTPFIMIAFMWLINALFTFLIYFLYF